MLLVNIYRFFTNDIACDILNIEARILSILGFGYLIVVVLIFLAYAIIAISDASIAEECGSDPKQFGVNQTHLWQCTLFGEGSLSEECTKDPQRFHVNKTECSKFIPPH
jgi:hypothetical protein